MTEADAADVQTPDSPFGDEKQGSVTMKRTSSLLGTGQNSDAIIDTTSHIHVYF